jgi:NAD(P)-dependent dehydrogenase (short-subunit alcohol dehydrogenase family)
MTGDREKPTLRPAVLITGAAKRIGAAIARDLAAKGWFVVIHHHRSAAAAAALLAEIEAAGGAGGTIRADLGQRKEVEALVATSVERFGPLDALVNNAALFRYDSPATLEAASWDAHLMANLTAPTFLARDFSRQVADGRQGVVVNVLDQKVMDNLNPDFFSYTVAKFGLRAVTELLAMALAPKVRVCGIAPGVTLISGRQTPESFLKSTRVTPLGRSSTVEELVLAVGLILATPSLNGEILTIDGGESLLRRRRDVAFETRD